jgi:hypothetical protein
MTKFLQKPCANKFLRAKIQGGRRCQNIKMENRRLVMPRRTCRNNLCHLCRFSSRSVLNGPPRAQSLPHDDRPSGRFGPMICLQDFPQLHAWSRIQLWRLRPATQQQCLRCANWWFFSERIRPGSGKPGQDSDEVDETGILRGIYMDFTLVVSNAWHSLLGVWAAGRVAHDTTNEGPAHLPGLPFCG